MVTDTGDKTILEQIDAVLNAAPAPAKRVMLAADRWNALCDETGKDPDSVLIQHHIAKNGAEHKVLIMPKTPIS